MPPHSPEIDNNFEGNRNTNVTVRNQGEEPERDGWCRNLTNKINHFLETIFASLGYVIASNPWKTIIIALVISALCMIGIIELQEENRGEKLWVSQSSDPVKHKEWIDDVFPLTNRKVDMMLESSDVGDLLTRKWIEKLYELDQKVKAMHNGTAEKQWTDICFSNCIPSSILELWSYNIDEIKNLTDADIKAKVNTIGLISPMTGRNLTVESFIGGPLTRDSNGLIIRATVLKVQYRLKKRDRFDSSKGQDVDEYADDWEEELENVMDQNFPGYTVYTYSQWSDEKASSDAANGDLQFFVVGYFLVIVYLSIMLGSFTRLGHKVYLALAGIGVIGISIGIAYGLGSAFQLDYTGVHNVLPFLLLGIGVDDIFVIVQSWDNIGGPKSDGRSIPDKISLAMGHAGVSVLVTSVTDICAFLIGSATILPALRSFSVWCAIGILAIFLLTITLFVALLTLDAKRQSKRRDACLCCMKIPDTWEPMKCSEKKYLKGFIKNYYAPAILSVPGKIAILLVVAGLLASGGYGLSELEQDFDYIWFFPPDSRPRMHIEKDRIAFPGDGQPGNVYIGQIDYFKAKDQMDKIRTTLEQDSFIAKGSINSWFHHYQTWLHQNHNGELLPAGCSADSCELPNETRFYDLLNQFLDTNEGLIYKRKIQFNSASGKIRASQIGYNHIKLVGSVQQVDAMDSITEVVKPGLINDGGEELLPFAFSVNYINWETNKVISKELIRNITLAGLCVLVVTLFLLSNLWASLMVVACVAFSLIEIAAFMGFWGLTIDTVTTIILVIAIGLTVDYSVHIAHGFMVAHGQDRNERATKALSEVGPAVIHGGTSTFLAFALLAASESYVFLTFFKVFFLVVLFGMFHGMVFLPVLMSLIGPAPYAIHNAQGQVGFEVTEQQAVQLQRAKKTNEDTFVVTVQNGEKNIAYVPE